MRIAGENLSPAQYAWLFGDLNWMQPEQAAEHWEQYGHREVLSLSRWPAQDRLARVKLQRFSDYPDEPPSEYALYQPCHGHSRLLNVIFSHANVPKGSFGFSQVAAITAGHIVYINTAGNDWYQRGTPGFSDSIEGLAASLSRFARHLQVTTIRTLGCSMGAYAAILFGHMLDAKNVVAIGPELQIGAPGFRSWDWNSAKVYREPDIGHCFDALGSRAEVFAPMLDPIDVRALGKRIDQAFHANVKHGDADFVRWEEFFRDAASSSIIEYVDHSMLKTRSISSISV